jgi:hypothetical protein
MNTKLKAFTLFELVLGMLLGAIVIGMAYYAGFIFVRIYDGYSKMNFAQMEVSSFKRTLGKDVARAVVINYQDDELVMKDQGGTNVLTYTFTKAYALRKSAVVDTFKLDELFVQASFDGQDMPSGRVDELKLYFNHARQPVSFLIRKNYAAADLFDFKR